MLNTCYSMHLEASASCFHLQTLVEESLSREMEKPIAQQFAIVALRCKKGIDHSFLNPWVILELHIWWKASFALSHCTVTTVCCIHFSLWFIVFYLPGARSKTVLGCPMMRVVLLIVCPSLWLSSFRRQWKTWLFIPAFNEILQQCLEFINLK